MGVLSLVVWAIVLIVAVKYVVFVMRADNEGEGGTMALLSLALPVAGPIRAGLLVVGLAGASLFFGDAIITPAISVLSAVEGLGVASPVVTPYVVPIAAVVLIGLFSIQSRGSGAVGFLFGPVMAAWFATLAVAGLVHLVNHPRVLLALNPDYALTYVSHAGAGTSFAVLGSVFLALTGGKALYADMGHFGRPAIRINWFAFVLPALVLVYLGQAALVADNPSAADNPFFRLFPDWLLIPAVLLTTAATVIASQAVLSGAFALVQQAIQLGAVPRLDVRQTSEESAGQVYVPQVNWLLAALVLALVFGFRSSDALANAYGIAVAGDMMVTTLLVTTVAVGFWRWPAGLVIPVAGLFFLLDVTFVSANVHKNSGRRLVSAARWSGCADRHARLAKGPEDRARAAGRKRHGSSDLHRRARPTRRPRPREGHSRVPHERTEIVPAALSLNVKHNEVVHEHVVLLKVTTEHTPRVAERNRVKVTLLPAGFRLLWLSFGFAEKPDVPATLRLHPEALGRDPNEVSFFLGRETPVPSLRPHLSAWEQRLYAFMTRNAVAAPDYFLIPPARVVELGTRVEM